MSTITLDMLTNAITSAHPTLPAAERGAMLAKVIRNIDAEMAREAIAAATPVQTTPKAKAPKAKAVKSAGPTLPNFEGRVMASGAGTASKGQISWLKANSKLSAADIAAISMVDASNYRALLSGRITAAQYNLLP